MNTKHTPKPWFAVGGVIYDGKNRVVARAGCLFNLEETDANARLIAAAPDLLAACKLALPLLDKLLESSHSIDGIVDSRVNLENDIGEIREAIAKATE